MDEQKNNTAPEPARARLKGWVKAVFIASITLNLLVGGVILGGVIRHDRHPPRTVVSDISMGPFTQALSNDDRQALRRIFAADLCETLQHPVVRTITDRMHGDV